jgi:tripartite-type tricarboxylate transporter receptor subunit TctC
MRQGGLTRRQMLKASAGALPLVVIARHAAAQAAYPARPVKVVIPYPPAGGADTVGRILFQKLAEMWGAQFVIDNRGGAGGTIAAAAVAKADRDGYTIMYDATAHSVNPSLYSNLPYDTVKDFQPVFLAALVTNLLVVNKSVRRRPSPT